MKASIIIAVALAAAGAASAGIVEKTVEYEHNGTMLEGYLAYDESVAGKAPGVLIAHEWTGLQDYEKRRAREIAGLGYVAFAMDVYGKGIRPTTAAEAAKEAGKYYQNRQLLRERAAAGVTALKNQGLADPNKLAAIGYCFGGSTVLELARSGADLDGVVTFHGGLGTPNIEDAKNIKGKVLVLTGAEDPHVPLEERVAFHEEMKAAGVDWQMILYGGAVHSFTNPKAGNDPSQGVAYDERADNRSWKAMKSFFKELFGSEVSR